MNDGLSDALRHNSWATATLLSACSGLSAEELEATAVGTHGGIAATFAHIVSSEGYYYRRLTGEQPDWLEGATDCRDLDRIGGWNDDLTARWERLLSDPFDAEITSEVTWHDGGVRDVPAGVVMAQAIHHGTDHRSQICTILTSIGIDPPHLGLWDWAEATDRARPRPR
ncbi:MAG TPA: DinB family protein [Acidimicrobiia bacterium]|nr:DinB family protein [Acidimicrobiia bacterium]